MHGQHKRDGNFEELKLVIHAHRKPENEHIHRYNEPESSEVAAIITGDIEHYIYELDIILRPKVVANANNYEECQKIHPGNRAYDSICYLFLVPEQA